jgi:hypothetical protein
VFLLEVHQFVPIHIQYWSQLLHLWMKLLSLPFIKNSILCFLKFIKLIFVFLNIKHKNRSLWKYTQNYAPYCIFSIVHVKYVMIKGTSYLHLKI